MILSLKRGKTIFLLSILTLLLGMGISLVNTSSSSAKQHISSVSSLEQVMIYVISIDNITDRVSATLKETDNIIYYANEGTKMKVYTNIDFTKNDLEELFSKVGQPIKFIDSFNAEVNLDKYKKG